jgi:ribonuclease T1
LSLSQLSNIKKKAMQYLNFLPTEVRDTLLKIKSGFNFTHKRDGSIYKNTESLLPQREMGNYREYTVPTPKIENRGSRRLVISKDGEIYYTDDHYQTFQQVMDIE